MKLTVVVVACTLIGALVARQAGSFAMDVAAREDLRDARVLALVRLVMMGVGGLLLAGAVAAGAWAAC